MITEEIGAVTESPGDDASLTVRSFVDKTPCFYWCSWIYSRLNVFCRLFLFFFFKDLCESFFFLDATVIDSWKNFRLSNCSYHTLGNLRSTRFWGDGNYNRTWRNDLYDIAHALADHLAVVVPSTTWNWSVCVCVVAKREYLTFIPIRFVAFSN